jgi:hypothetical protein
MNVKAQVNTPAKAPAAPAAAHIPRPPVAVPEHEVEQPAMATQLEGAARLGHSFSALGVDSPAPPIIQRQELPEEDEEEKELQMKREPVAVQRQEKTGEEEEEEKLQMKPDLSLVGLEGGPVSPEVEAAIRRARGGGQPLEGTVQAQMSEALGHDFSGVRVHTDADADQLNQQLQAKAFTTGPDIFFKRGTYDPGSSRGRELIAHELIHVVQQSSSWVPGTGSGLIVRPAADAFEQEADEHGRRVVGQWAVANSDLASPADILALQRHYGNYPVSGVLQSAVAWPKSRGSVIAGPARRGINTLSGGTGIIQRADLALSGAIVDEKAPGANCYQYVAAVLLVSGRPDPISAAAEQDIEAAMTVDRDAIDDMFKDHGVAVMHPDALADAHDGAIIGIRRGVLHSYADHVMIKISSRWYGKNNPDGAAGLRDYAQNLDAEIFNPPPPFPAPQPFGGTFGQVEAVRLIDGLENSRARMAATSERLVARGEVGEWEI